MKIVSLLILLLVGAGTTRAQVTNPDTMVRRIFSVLKAKDEKAFVALYPNGQQMGRLVRKMMGGLKDIMQQEMAKAGKDSSAKNLNLDSLINSQAGNFDDPTKYKEMEQEFAKEYQKIMAKSEAKGVDWSKAQLVKYTMDTAAVTDQAMAQMFGDGEFKAMKGVIDFTVNDSAYQMAFDKVMYLPDEKGWFGVGFKQIARKGESLEPDEEKAEEVEEMETIEMPPPPPPKSTTKKPAAKKITAAKKPAVKPKAATKKKG